MKWDPGERPVTKRTVEERILRGLWLTGMSKAEAIDFLDLHNATVVMESTGDLYQEAWNLDEADVMSRPRTRWKERAWEAGRIRGARSVHHLAVKKCEALWREWKRRYAHEMEEGND